MTDEKNMKQSMDDQRMQKATINISGIPGEEDDELLCTLYHMIKAEHERGCNVQKRNFAVKQPKSS